MITGETKLSMRRNTGKKFVASITNCHIGINSLNEFGNLEVDTVISEKFSKVFKTITGDNELGFE